MQFDPPLQPAILLKRYKRFLADVVTPDGRELTLGAHLPLPDLFGGEPVGLLIA